MSASCGLRPDPKRYGSTFDPGAECVHARGHSGQHHAHAHGDGCLTGFRFVLRESLEQLAGPVAASVRELARVTGLTIDDALDLIVDVLDGGSE